MNHPWKLLITRRAERDIDALETTAKLRIRRALDRISVNPFASSKRLSGDKIGYYRVRAGDMRIIFDIDGDEIIVLRVGNRREIYRR